MKTLVLLLLADLGLAQSMVTVAGGGAGDGGPALLANLAGPEGVAVDRAGNVYVADTSNHRIRKIGSDGFIHTIAGNGQLGPLRFPVAVAVDSAGQVFVSDTYNGVVRQVGGAVVANGLSLPAAVAFDSAGLLYIAESGERRIVRVREGRVEGVAGNLGRVLGLAFSPAGELHFSEQDENRVRKIGPGGDIVTVASAGLSGPFGLAFDAAGDLLVADEGNHRVVRVKAAGELSTLAGALASPQGVAADDRGNVFVAEFGGNRVLRIRADGSRSAFAGTGEPYFSGDNGPATNAALNLPQGISFDSRGDLWIADRENNRIRRVSRDGTIATIAPKAAFLRPAAVASDGAGNAYVADTGHHTVVQILADGSARSVAGGGSAGFSGDGGEASKALLHAPAAVALHPGGDLLIADSGNRRIRAVSPAGRIRTYHSGEYEPSALAVDGSGNVWIADRSRGIVIEVSARGQTLASMSGFMRPQGLAIDPKGNVYVADSEANRVFLITSHGPAPVLTEGLLGPQGLAFDSEGSLFIADSRSHRILEVKQLTPRPTLAPAQTKAPGGAALADGVEGKSPSLAPYVPTPAPIVERMLELARVTASDIVYDLGSGDGRIPILAALHYGAKAVGIELQPDLVEAARRRVSELRLENLVRIRRGDILNTDLSAATVITIYLLPEHMPQLARVLEPWLRNGGRIVSHDAEFPGWRPAQTASIPGDDGRVHNLYLYLGVKAAR